MTTCRSCGEPIDWVKMEGSGKAMPIDRKLQVIVVRNPDGTGRCVSGYFSHFATCPRAAEHRREG